MIYYMGYHDMLAEICHRRNGNKKKWQNSQQDKEQNQAHPGKHSHFIFHQPCPIWILTW
jgi:hypothetical protein